MINIRPTEFVKDLMYYEDYIKDSENTSLRAFLLSVRKLYQRCMQVNALVDAKDTSVSEWMLSSANWNKPDSSGVISGSGQMSHVPKMFSQPYASKLNKAINDTRNIVENHTGNASEVESVITYMLSIAYSYLVMSVQITTSDFVAMTSMTSSGDTHKIDQLAKVTCFSLDNASSLTDYVGWVRPHNSIDIKVLASYNRALRVVK